MLTITILVVLVFIAVYAVSLYNTLRTLKVRIKASAQEIGNQLKRQTELIPNLVESAKGYMKHEKDVFKMLTDARKQVVGALKSNDLNEMVKASESIASALPKIQATFESNPEIKATVVVQELMQNLRDTSDKVSYSRRLLIDLSADYNTKIVTFPGNIVAGMLGFNEEKGLVAPESGEHIEVNKEEVKTPKVEL